MAKRKKDEEYRTFQAGSARHFDTRHTTFASKCPAGDSRKKACQELLCRDLQAINVLPRRTRWYGMVWYWNSASFAGALAIVRNGKPFTDGEYAKTLITVHDRTIMMSNQIEATQDESTDVSHLSQFSVIARYVVSDTLREESLAVLPMKGEDLFKSFTEFMCGEQLGEVMSLIIWVVNFIFARALNDHQFRTLLDKVGNNYPGLLLHSNVCWSSRGKVLSCFAACLSEIRTFLEMKNVEHPELANNEWLLKFYYLVDMTEHLNQLNVKMQGVGNTVLSLQQALFAFENKLELFVVHITYHTLQRVSIAVLTMFGSTYACEQSFSHLQNIKTNLRSRLTNGSLNACMNDVTLLSPFNLCLSIRLHLSLFSQALFQANTFYTRDCGIISEHFLLIHMTLYLFYSLCYLVHTLIYLPGYFFLFFFLLLTAYLIPYSFGLSYSYRKCYS
uniref:HAT C-terminal dimerisation domain-containing protein n=1 Tax=Pundamilia nyererei TaxID=303518 RepID=A0A3B4FMV8_9CICH